MTISHLLLYILGCILLIGFFAGTEIAFISANKLNIELRKKQGKFSGQILARFMENPSEFIGTSLVGVNVLVVIYGLLLSQTTELILKNYSIHLSEYPKLAVDTLIATVVILIFAEFLPKAIFRSKAEVVLTIFAVPMLLMYYLFFPIAKVFVSISEFILKYLFNVKIKENKQVFNRVDLEVFVKQGMHGHENENGEVNAELFENALYLVNVRIRKCMVPRNEVEAIDINTTTVEEARQKFIQTKLSKIIVYNDTIDDIVGYIHHLDLNRRPGEVKEILHTITAIPEAMSAVDLMNRFTKERKSIAWVVDEFGGTAGIVTMEDVLEEIFGDINDEYDIEEHVEKQLAENEYIFSGRLELDYLNEKYGFEFPTEQSETLSGYIIAGHETIPKIKEQIILDDYEFDILLVTDTRIETVKMKVLSRK
ncbi:HlyC/CorC family transporter [Flavipsychrobacter stenotrophus]|uniref:HlyC/CorC family transporter n=1 Tax=Flavipsychrobacter stenotrophus TaxID=2077091 RepID=A0A2S7SXV7_9BACT|nr:hemolysin family protein [Flavipsychrobacter stenotrophus]PQJ11356.1 HlyC/CorC family transporter [Flavipsychrobacter stenotrophus]